MSDPAADERFWSGTTAAEQSVAREMAEAFLAKLSELDGGGLTDWEGEPNDRCVRAMVESLRYLDRQAKVLKELGF